MRISKIAILASLAGGVALSAPAFLEPAFAVQDQPMTMGGIEAVCTGVGSAKDNPAWGGYPPRYGEGRGWREHERREDHERREHGGGWRDR